MGALLRNRRRLISRLSYSYHTNVMFSSLRLGIYPMAVDIQLAAAITASSTTTSSTPTTCRCSRASIGCRPTRRLATRENPYANNINNVDAIVAALAETHLPGSSLGRPR